MSSRDGHTGTQTDLNRNDLAEFEADREASQDTKSGRAKRRSPADSYKPLHDFLEDFGSDQVMFSFKALENMLGRKLPASALDRETWWTNKPKGRGHAKAWRDAGWAVEAVDLDKGRVTFARTSGP